MPGGSQCFFLNTENQLSPQCVPRSVGWLPQVLGVLVATIRCHSPELYRWLSHPNVKSESGHCFLTLGAAVSMTVTAPFTAAGSTITLDDIAGTCRRGRDASNRFRFLLLTGLLYCRTNLRSKADLPNQPIAPHRLLHALLPFDPEIRL